MMRMRVYQLSLLLGFYSLLPSLAAATPPLTNQQLYNQYPWMVTYYYGITVSDALVRIFEGDFHRYPEHVQSLELAHTLNSNNVIRRFFSPVVGVVQIAGNLTVRNGSNE